MPLHTNLWTIETPVARSEATYLEKEFDRWTQLLEDPASLSMNPLQYGPLSVDGFMHARTHDSLRKHDSWPKDPQDIANLLAHCEMKYSFEAKYIAQQQNEVTELESNMAITKIFSIHKALLEKLGITPGVKELLEFVDGFDWGHSYAEDYLYSFDIMKTYLPTLEDQQKFLVQWLPTLKSSKNAYGISSSLGTVLAASFPIACSDLIAEWCMNNDDQVGLGYLVWQDRLSFTAWLFEVAEPTRGAAIRSWSNDYLVSVKMRRDEQLATLRLLSQRVPLSRLQTEGKVFSDTYPELLNSLLERTEKDAASDENMRWAFGLLEAQVIPLDHVLITGWLSRANAVHEEIIADYLAKNVKFSEMSASSLDEKMHYTCGPISAIIGDKARDILARDIVLRADGEKVGQYLANMPDKSWLYGVDVYPLINARKHDGLHKATNMMIAFYPFMPVHHQKEAAQHLINCASNGSIKVGNAASTMFSVDPEHYMHGISSKHKDLAHMMHLLTGVDPEVLFSTMTSLEINKSDPLYTSMVREWVSNNIGDTHVVTTPNDIGDNLFGVF